jgi:hypothetical protein
LTKAYIGNHEYDVLRIDNMNVYFIVVLITFAVF